MVRFFPILVLFACVALQGAVPVADISVSKGEATVGDAVEFRLLVKSDDKVLVTVPEKRAYTGKEIKILNPPVPTNTKDRIPDIDQKEMEDLPLFVIEDVTVAEKKDLTEVKVIVRYFKPGMYEMPPVGISYGNNLDLTYVRPTTTIKETNPQGELADIENPLNLSGNLTRLILLLIAASILGACIYALVRYIKKKRVVVEKKPEIPAIITFRQEIDYIGIDLAGGSMDAELYGIKISHAVRKLLSAKYSFDAMEMTSTEVVARMKKVRLDDGWLALVDDLEKVSMLWEMNKFAEFTPTQNLMVVNLRQTADLGEKFWRG